MENENKLRYGISALDLKYKEYSDNDELMVNGPNGKMYYKREDGQIVSYDNLEYNKQSLVLALNGAIASSDIKIHPSENDYIIYHTIDISGKNDILSDTATEFNFESSFSISKSVKAFFIRVRGNNNTNSVVSFIESFMNDEESVKFTFTIKAIGDTENSVDVESGGMFNDLLLVKIPDINVENITRYEVKIKSIKFNVKPTYNNLVDLQKELIDVVNNNNVKFEADGIDVISYLDDMSLAIIVSDVDKIKLFSIYTVYDINSEKIETEPVVISKELPDHKCLWVKIKE